MAKSPFSPDDIYRFRWIDHVRLTPTADRVAYVVRWADRDAVEYRSRVYVRGLDGEDLLFQATGGPQTDAAPEWAPDGRRLAYVGRKGFTTQVFVLDPAAGEARQLTAVPLGATSPRWSPDGSMVAFLGTVIGHPEGVVADPRPPEGGAEAAPRTPIARVVQGFDYSYDGRGYFDGRRPHLFVVKAEGGDAIQLTQGRWQVESFDWSPDSTSLVVAGDAETDNDLHVTRSLYVVSAGGGELRKIAGDLDLGAPAWSPKGDLIAFAAPTHVAAGLYDRIWLVSPAGGDQRCITSAHDVCAGDQCITDMRAGHAYHLGWDEAGNRIYFQAARPGRTALCSVDVGGEEVREEVGGDREVFDFDVRNAVIAYLAAESSAPGDLHVVDARGERRLTRLNPWFDERALALPEPMRFEASDGLPIEGWLLKPPGFDPARKWPLVMEIHGGPHGEYSTAFFHEFQILTGMGFLVFYANPRGSGGYGEEFMKAVVQDWAGKDYDDLMTALDQLIERTGFVDTERMGVAGGSYGGFMTNWAVGHTDRFAAAVAMRSICDFVSDYATSDIPVWGELEFGPIKWSDPRKQWEMSPLKYVENVRTPLLLTHGEIDLRCPIHQAEEMFGALRLLRRPVELVRFPEEAHDLSRTGRPDRRVERLRRITGWFERYLLQTAMAEPAVEHAAAAAPAE
jgi:dipeptidyl aminopeptidase/acylaminoacyl peptidase